MLDLSEGGLLPGGIKDEIAAARFGRRDAAHLRRVVALWDLDCDHHMVAESRGGFGIDYTVAMIDPEVCRMDADGGEHRGEQCRFVLAVAVTVVEDVAGEVRLITADTHLDD